MDQDRVLALYIAWLNQNGLPHSEANLGLFLRILALRVAAESTSPQASIHPQQESRAPNRGEPKWGRWFALVVLVVVVAVIWGVATYPGTPSSTTSETGDAPPNENPGFTAPKMPRPASGEGNFGWRGGGCLELMVPYGDDYHVKLKSGGSTYWEVYLAGGSSLTLEVPLGTFDLVYGSGSDWYGWDYGFGPTGAYAAASDSFTFESDSCWSVQLIPQVGGNLGSSSLRYDDF